MAKLGVKHAETHCSTVKAVRASLYTGMKLASYIIEKHRSQSRSLK